MAENNRRLSQRRDKSESYCVSTVFFYPRCIHWTFQQYCSGWSRRPTWVGHLNVRHSKVLWWSLRMVLPLTEVLEEERFFCALSRVLVAGSSMFAEERHRRFKLTHPCKPASSSGRSWSVAAILKFCTCRWAAKVSLSLMPACQWHIGGHLIPGANISPTMCHSGPKPSFSNRKTSVFSIRGYRIMK